MVPTSCMRDYFHTGSDTESEGDLPLSSDEQVEYYYVVDVRVETLFIVCACYSHNASLVTITPTLHTVPK